MEMRHTDAVMHEKAEGKLQTSLQRQLLSVGTLLPPLGYFQHEKASGSLWLLVQK